MSIKCDDLMANKQKNSKICLDDLDIHVTVVKANGLKCERCWRWTQDVGLDKDYPTLCWYCVQTVNSILLNEKNSE